MDLATSVSQLIRTLLEDEGITLHAVSHRCKERKSLAGKLSRQGKSYEQLQDITDLAGIRLTTYFADDVDRVASILQRELDVDFEDSVDKRIHSDPNRFGYLSLHYIAKLTDERTSLREYRRYRDLKFEVQIRSILQHAWAEIEHDLGYKSESGIPADIRRRFARVAGLLELADSEFTEIRHQLSTHALRLPEIIESTPEAALIDLPTLKFLVEEEISFINLDNNVVSAAKGYIEGSSLHALESSIDKLRFFGVTRVDQLKKIVVEKSLLVRKFSAYWVEDSLGGVSSGIGLFYLCYVLAWETKNIDTIKSYLDTSNIDSDFNRNSLAHQILRFDPSAEI